MKDYKNTHGARLLMIFTLMFYILLPPVLTTCVFNRFNLNPFAIVKFLHFNPFFADRGIPGYQTFLYLLMLWLGVNILLWLMVWGAGRLYQRWRALRDG
ncbi:hypothetical protein [Serratia marcescens]|uniref:hypothetical protein n=1 Tax=Serratia marcescens TaxID=615 RepID=UPI0011E71808|nr:hypothetical protein [Serratia marcescens]